MKIWKTCMVRMMGVAVLSLLGAALTTAAAADLARGRKLLESHCLQCHSTASFTRADRKVKDLPGLKKRVRLCELSLDLHWKDADLDDVVGYLNSAFYHFK
jgi:hypothetical protein